MRVLRLLGGLVRKYTSKQTRAVLVARCDEKGPLVVAQCGTVVVERRAVRLVVDYAQPHRAPTIFGTVTSYSISTK